MIQICFFVASKVFLHFVFIEKLRVKTKKLYFSILFLQILGRDVKSFTFETGELGFNSLAGQIIGQIELPMLVSTAIYLHHMYSFLRQLYANVSSQQFVIQ